MNSPRNSHPNSPNREVKSRSPKYEPPPLESESEGEDETKDQDMVGLTKDNALTETEEVSMSIEEPAC